jgi:hypothetical protein
MHEQSDRRHTKGEERRCVGWRRVEEGRGVGMGQREGRTVEPE